MSAPRVKTLDRVVVIRPSGSLLGGPESEALEQAFDAALRGRAPGVVLDLEEVPVINSTGLGMLTQVAVRAQQAGARVAICRSQRRVAEMFRLLHLPYWTLFAAEAEAVGHAAARPAP